MPLPFSLQLLLTFTFFLPKLRSRLMCFFVPSFSAFSPPFPEQKKSPFWKKSSTVTFSGVEYTATQEKVRLIGIDAPELKPNQRAGEQAAA